VSAISYVKPFTSLVAQLLEAHERLDRLRKLNWVLGSRQSLKKRFTFIWGARAVLSIGRKEGKAEGYGRQSGISVMKGGGNSPSSVHGGPLRKIGGTLTRNGRVKG